MVQLKDGTIRLAVALLLASSATAQNTANTAATNQPAATQPANQQTTAATNQPATNQPATNQPAATTNAPANNAPTVVITGVPTATTAKSSSSAGNSPSTAGGLTDLPTIAGYGIPTMIVPDTKGAPYMVQSNLPEGTVFIVIGAVLGFLAFAIVAWRGLIAWSIHRSVKRANEKMLYQPESMKTVRPGYGGAASLANQSNLSMDHLGGTTSNLLKKNNTTPIRSNIATSTVARNSSLFFSPTAGHGGAANSSSTYLPGNRSSSFLPAGYYAAPGAGSPAQGATHSHVGSGTPQRASRYSRYHDVSPPGSPGLPPSSRGMDSVRGGNQGHGMYYQPSTSSLNLNLPGGSQSGGRAPSANLDDMLGDHHLGSAR